MKHNLEDLREEAYRVQEEESARCPECGSYDITLERLPPSESLMGYQYKCCDCGTTFL